MDDVANDLGASKGLCLPIEHPGGDGQSDKTINLDIQTMKMLRERLSLSDFGRLSVQIARASSASRPSELQRLLLAVVRHRETADES